MSIVNLPFKMGKIYLNFLRNWEQWWVWKFSRLASLIYPNARKDKHFFIKETINI